MQHFLGGHHIYPCHGTIQYPQHRPMPRQRPPYEDNDTPMERHRELAPENNKLDNAEIMRIGFYHTANSWWYLGLDHNKQWGWIFIYFLTIGIGIFGLRRESATQDIK